MLPTTLARTAAGAALAALLSATPVAAQKAAPAGKPMTNQPSNLAAESAPKPQFMPPGMMMGPATITASAMERQCDPRSAGFTGWRIDQFEHALTLNDDQKKKLDDFKTASAKALDDIVATCSGNAPITPVGQLDLMEKRLTAQLEAVKTMRQAFDPFYASLNDEQKARLTSDPLGRGWRWQTVGDNRRRR